MSDGSRIVSIEVTEQRFPPYDPAHGTPDEMLRRVLSLTLPAGHATFEQTDYGHPGRLNPWEPRGVDSALQPRTDDLKALCTWISSLLS
jgi:hypothetical protein